MEVQLVSAAMEWCSFFCPHHYPRTYPNINCKQSRNPDAMHLIRYLTLIECAYDLVLVSKHLPGKHNSMADALSCNQLSAFLSLYPQASSLPTPVPSSLLQVNCGMSEARLDLCKLGNSVCKYFQKGLAPSTQRSYELAKAHFINFCSSARSYTLLLSLKTCVFMSHF